MYKNINVEAEHNELILENSNGDKVIIPANKRNWVKQKLSEGCNGCIDSLVETLPVAVDYAEDGTVVSALYTQKTGKDWNTAKQEGLTTGSYDDNMKLRQRLLSGELDNKQLNTNTTISNNNTNNSVKNQDYTKAKDFNEAFGIARNQLGTNQIFEYQGRKYGTNLKGEKFEPSEEILIKNNMNKPEVKERLQNQNKLTESVYSTKKTTKLEPQYQDWDKVKQRKNEINKMNQADIIKQYYKDSNEQYLVLDKKRGKMHLMKGNKEITSYNVGTGANVGDEQTKTVIKDGKVMWDEGNKMTGAGVYTVSGVNPKNAHYSGAPSWNFKNESGIEVPMALHSSFGNRTAKIKNDGVDAGDIYKYNDTYYLKDKITGDWKKNIKGDPTDLSGYVPLTKGDLKQRYKVLDSQAKKFSSFKDVDNRLSNGCINGICYNLKDLYKKGYKEGQKLYVLPDEDNNTYEMSNEKLIFKSKDANVNRTENTLNYKPIKIIYPEDYSEELPKMAKALEESKQKLMKDLRINGDVYNDIAELTLGVAGQETDYGNSMKYKLKTETTQDVLKYLVGNTSYNSKGLTQLKYDAHIKNKEIKTLFDNYGITKDNLEDGDKAALAQLILFSTMYKYELPAYKDVDIADMDKLLYLNQGKRSELKNNTATPDKNIYIRNVNKYKNKIKLQQLN